MVGTANTLENDIFQIIDESLGFEIRPILNNTSISECKVIFAFASKNFRLDKFVSFRLWVEKIFIEMGKLLKLC